MNFTLSTLLVIFFLIPGFIFRRAYYSSPFPRKYSKFSLFGEISWIIIPSFIIQILGIYLIYWMWHVNFLELKNFYHFLIECYKTNPDFKSDLNFHVLIIYTAILWALAFILGYLINLVIRRSHLDKRVKIFSFDNEWYYYLSGEILDFPNIEGTSKEVGLTFVDALTKTGEETILYSGICQKFDLKEDGGLASICLTNVQRKRFLNTSDNKDNNGTEVYKDIPSTFLVIPFEQIINLNVRFFKVHFKKKQHLAPVVGSQPLKPIEEEKEKEEKIETNLSIAEVVLLTLTLLIIIVAIISIFSKPDKPREEVVEDYSGLGTSILLIVLVLVLRFGIGMSWLSTILIGLGSAVIILFIISLITSKKK